MWVDYSRLIIKTQNTHTHNMFPHRDVFDLVSRHLEHHDIVTLRLTCKGNDYNTSMIKTVTIKPGYPKFDMNKEFPKLERLIIHQTIPSMMCKLKELHLHKCQLKHKHLTMLDDIKIIKMVQCSYSGIMHVGEMFKNVEEITISRCTLGGLECDTGDKIQKLEIQGVPVGVLNIGHALKTLILESLCVEFTDSNDDNNIEHVRFKSLYGVYQPFRIPRFNSCVRMEIEKCEVSHANIYIPRTVDYLSLVHVYPNQWIFPCMFGMFAKEVSIIGCSSSVANYASGTKVTIANTDVVNLDRHCDVKDLTLINIGMIQHVEAIDDADEVKFYMSRYDGSRINSKVFMIDGMTQ